MTKHTPTPEIINYILNNAVANIESRERLFVEDRKALEVIRNGHIVKCVNVHEDLIGALKGLLKAADQMNEHIDVTSYNKAQEALKKAGAL